MNKHVGTVAAMFLAAVTCGAIFLLALLRQFALVEVAASLATGVEVYFLSSSIGDLLEDKKEPSRLKFVASLAVAAGIVAYFLTMRLMHK